MAIFSELDNHWLKSEVTYKLWKAYGPKNKKVEITVTVHLDNQERTVTIRGINKTFEFTKSDPYLIAAVNELIEKGLELANAEQRVKEPKEDAE